MTDVTLADVTVSDAPAPAAPTGSLALVDIINQLRTSWGGDDEGHTRSWVGTTVNYSIVETPFGFPLPDEFAGITAITDTQKAFIRDAFDMWDDLIAINLTETTGIAPLSIGYTSTTDGGGTYATPDVFHLLSGGEDLIISERIWLSTSWTDLMSGNLSYGSYGLETILHEIGHALGLSHPGSYNASDDPPPTYATSAEYLLDTRQYTIMSYFGAENYNTTIDRFGAAVGNTLPYANVATPLLHDIAAIQAIYGADFTTRAGNTVYGFNSTADRTAFDFTVNFNPVIAIWDGGGIDTLDCSGYVPDGSESYNQYIDLGAGKFSDIGALTGNVAIAYNCVIENAIGGGGNDSIQGNAVGNRLEGADGDDVLLGLIGNDVLIGGAGHDQLFGHAGDDVLTGGSKDDLLYGGGGVDYAAYTSSAGEIVTITPVDKPSLGLWSLTGPLQAIGDTLAGIEGFIFGSGSDRITILNAPGKQNVAINAGGGNDVIIGNSDRETMIGGTGGDDFRPQAGQFAVFGGFFAPQLNNWIESLADGDILNLDRHNFGADYSFINIHSFPLGWWTGTDGSTARGIARINYIGSDFADLLWGALGSDSFSGNGGADKFYGDTGNDGASGGVGDDRLEGGGGNDLLKGGAGNDVLAGDDGNDTLLGGEGVDVFSGGAGNDRIETGGGGDVAVAGYDGNDLFIGSDDAEQFYGGNDNDTIIASGGADFLDGAEGNDDLQGGAGNDLILTGRGIETVDGGADFDILNVYRDLTTLGVTFALTGAVQSIGTDGTTVVNVEQLLYLAGSGDDNLTGFDGADALYGNGGTDRLYGGGGGDRLEGGLGNDVLDGGDGSDLLLGGDGEDKLRGGLGVDNLQGGAGNDWLDTGGGSGDGADGGDGDDTVIGSSELDQLSGGNDDDILTGKAGNDFLFGGAGDDTLQGGADDDTYVGGLGNDTFEFNVGIGSETVSDFDSDPVGGQDRLDISAFGYSNFVAMLAGGVTIAAGGAFGANTIITFGINLPIVTLFVTAVASIDGSDFLF